MFYRNYKRTLDRCYTYKDILLKDYIEISETGNLNLLLKSGGADPAHLIKIWDDIVNTNAKECDIVGYNNYLSDVKSYGYLNNEYVFIRATLLKLLIKYDSENIKELKQKGYKINIDPNEYIDSILSAVNKSNNLLTKIEMKRKEIERLYKKDEGKRVSFGEVVANMEIAMGRHVEDSITLNKFNALKKILKSKEKKDGKN